MLCSFPFDFIVSVILKPCVLSLSLYRKRFFIQTLSCVPSWLWLHSPSVPAQFSSPFKLVEAHFMILFSQCISKISQGIWLAYRFFMLISPPTPSSIHSLLLASSCTSWPGLWASLRIISCLSFASSCHGSAWLTPCSAPESTASLRSEVSVCSSLFTYRGIFLLRKPTTWIYCTFKEKPAWSK